MPADPATPPPPGDSEARTLAAWLSAGLAAFGALLMAWMMAVEGEPGALPLLLVVGGAAGHVAVRVRSRAAARRPR